MSNLSKGEVVSQLKELLHNLKVREEAEKEFAFYERELSRINAMSTQDSYTHQKPSDRCPKKDRDFYVLCPFLAGGTSPHCPRAADPAFARGNRPKKCFYQKGIELKRVL